MMLAMERTVDCMQGNVEGSQIDNPVCVWSTNVPTAAMPGQATRTLPASREEDRPVRKGKPRKW